MEQKEGNKPVDHTPKLWYNFVTEQYDELLGVPQDDDVAVQYLPRYRGLSQDAPTSSWQGPAVTLYKLYRDDGDSTKEAMRKVLVMCSGRKRAAGKVSEGVGYSG